MKINNFLLIVFMVLISLLAVSAVSAADVNELSDNSIISVADSDISEAPNVDQGLSAANVEANARPEINITTQDTPYNEMAKVDITTTNINATMPKVNVFVDGVSVKNLTLFMKGKGTYNIPAKTYDVGKHTIDVSYNDTTYGVIKSSAVLNILQVTPVVNVSDVTVKVGEIVTVPFTVTDNKGKGMEGKANVTIYLNDGKTVSQIVEFNDSSKFNFDFSKLFNGTSLFNGTGLNISGLFNGSGFNISSMFNGTNFNISGIFNGTTFNITGMFNGSGLNLTGILNGTDFKALFNGTDFSSKFNITSLDFTSLFNRTSVNSPNAESSGLLMISLADAILNADKPNFNLGNWSKGNSTFDISGILDGLGIDLSKIFGGNAKEHNATFDYPFDAGIYKMSVEYLGNGNYASVTNDTAKLTVLGEKELDGKIDPAKKPGDKTTVDIYLTNETRQPIPGAAVDVILNGVHKGTVILDVNGHGRFTFDNLTAGHYVLVLRYQNLTKTFEFNITFDKNTTDNSTEKSVAAKTVTTPATGNPIVMMILAVFAIFGFGFRKQD